MPKVAKELSALDVKRLNHPGGKRNSLFAVGGVPGLHLQITPKAGRSWVLRTKVGAKRRDFGLGGFPAVTLAQAREKARDMRSKIGNGVDPIMERKTIQAALEATQRRGLTFEEAVDKALEHKLNTFTNPKHRQQWQNTLSTYAIPELGKMRVEDVSTHDILRVLQPIWTTKTETASRLRSRIEAVLSWATVAGHRTGDNPARWAGNLKELLPAPSKIAKHKHHPALTLDDAPRWFEALQRCDGFGARALTFAALTATRSQEVRGATWDEINLEKALWIIPGDRMKMGKEHRIPLTDHAIALLETLPRLNNNLLVFPAARGGKLSDMTLSATMKRMHSADLSNGGAGYFDRQSNKPAVPHGLRSTFRDWAAEMTSYPSDMAEVALAHKIRNAVEASYRRGDMIQKRRRMMQDWSCFLTGSAQLRNVLEVRFGQE